MKKTKIDWAERVWNPVTGCTKVSAGCKNCYAERVANRFWGDRKFTNVQVRPERLGQPLKRKKPSVIFVNSMSDLFHDDVPAQFISSVFDVMEACQQHIFLILTKREHLIYRYPFPDLPNMWLGVSVENQECAEERIPKLIGAFPYPRRFISCEPLLKGIDLSKWLDRSLIEWVIVGGESGSNARAMHPDWVRSIRDQCQIANVPFFFKQWGEWSPIKPKPFKPVKWGVHGVTSVYCVGKTKAGHLLDGREYREVPGAIAEIKP